MVAYEPFLSLVFAPVPVYSNCELFSNICSQLLIVNVWKNVRRLNTFTISLLTVNLQAKRTTFSTKRLQTKVLLRTKSPLLPMEIIIDLNKSVDENAGIYFDLSKKNKKKLEGAKAALEETRKKLVQLQKQEHTFREEETKKREKTQRKREWYERFHWFISSEGFLCIGGKDATSNEIVIKKHLEKDDLVLHTDMSGSPFFVIKNGQQAGEKTIEEAAQAVAANSRAWKLGYSTIEVFYVKPEQVSKEAKAGESLAKGSFMIYGKTTYLHPKIESAVGLLDDEIIGGPIAAIENKTKNYVVVIPGREKKSALAKKIKAKLKGGDLDDIIKFIPAGGAEVKK